MTTTYSPLTRLNLPGVNDVASKNLWGGLENTNMVLIESAIVGVSVVSVAGLTTYTLTTASGQTDQARPYALQLTGTPGGSPYPNCTVTLPNVQRFGLVQNLTGATITLTTGAGTTLLLRPPHTGWLQYYCDGTNISQVSNNLGSFAAYVTSFSSSQTITVPEGVTSMRFRLQGAGTQGGPGAAGFGGSGGGYVDMVVPVTTASTFTLAIDAYGNTSVTWLDGSGVVVKADAGVVVVSGQTGGTGNAYIAAGTWPLGSNYLLQNGQLGNQGLGIFLDGAYIYMGGAGGSAGSGASGGNINTNQTAPNSGNAGVLGSGGSGAAGLGSTGGPGGLAYVTAEW